MPDDPQRHLVLVLNSSGGDMFAATKIAHLLRSKCRRLSVLVPERAKSAATLMSLAGDEIVMGLQSELGPLDKPYEHPLLPGTDISSCDVIRSLADIHETAEKLSVRYAMAFRNQTGIGMNEALGHGCALAAEIVRPLLAKEDPRVVALCTRRQSMAVALADRLLSAYMFKEQDGQATTGYNARIREIVERLAWGFPDHGFAILRHDALSTGLKVVDAEKFDGWNRAWVSFNLFRKRLNDPSDSLNKVILFSPGKG